MDGSAGSPDPFHYRDGHLHVEDVGLAEIAERFGSPTYVYSRRALEAQWRAFDSGLAPLPHLVCFAVKANSNLGVLNVLARLGSGFDIVSVGELERVLAAGGDPSRTVFSGVGKNTTEMRRALEVGIRCFNVESLSELDRLEAAASASRRTARVSLRVNPDVDPLTHPYIATGLSRNKFGIPIGEAREAYRHAAALAHLEVVGVDCHIGSQLTAVSPVADALDRVLSLVADLAADGIELTEIDVGGGLGIRYRDESPPSPAAYCEVVREKLAGCRLEVVLEPGRAICGNAGVLLTRVEYLKRNGERNFAIVDAAMNDFLRPALYDGWSRIVSVGPSSEPERLYDVVGPICESGDFLGKERSLSLREGSLLALLSAGAYGFAMSSNYNSRPRAAEVMADGSRAQLVRDRETVPALFANESVLADEF